MNHMRVSLFSQRRVNACLRSRLLAGSSLGLFGVLSLAVQSPAQAQTQQEQVLITGEKPGDYKVDAPTLPKLTEPLVDTPQSIDTISQQLLQDQAVTNLNDAFRNVPSITIGAGEFKSLGTSPTIRGFVARTDMFLDGQRDIGDYYRDPFDLEEIQVLEGPASVLFGRGSTGGVINQVSKMPELTGFIAGALTFGTDLTRRLTVDIDEPLPDLGPGAAMRIDAMGHDSKLPAATSRNRAATVSRRVLPWAGYTDAVDGFLLPSVCRRCSRLRPTLFRKHARRCAAAEFLRLHKRLHEDWHRYRDGETGT